MTKPDVIHGTGGHIWTGDSDTPPATAIPIKGWTVTLKPKHFGYYIGWLGPTNSIANVTGSISGNFASAMVSGPSSSTTTTHRPGGRKAERMRRRGY